MLFMISFLSFISTINCTALPYLFFVISFKCCRVEFPPHYRSCLLAPGKISRLAFCFVRFELKLRHFCKPTVIGLKSGAGCKYLTSIWQALTSSHKPVFITLNYQGGLNLKLKALMYSKILALNKSLALLLSVISCQHGNNDRTKPVKDQLSQQF